MRILYETRNEPLKIIVLFHLRVQFSCSIDVLFLGTVPCFGFLCGTLHLVKIIQLRTHYISKMQLLSIFINVKCYCKETQCDDENKGLKQYLSWFGIIKFTESLLYSTNSIISFSLLSSLENLKIPLMTNYRNFFVPNHNKFCIFCFLFVILTRYL